MKKMGFFRVRFVGKVLIFLRTNMAMLMSFKLDAQINPATPTNRHLHQISGLYNNWKGRKLNGTNGLHSQTGRAEGMEDRLSKTIEYLQRGYYIVAIPRKPAFVHTGTHAMTITRDIISELLKSCKIQEVLHSEVIAKFPATRPKSGDKFYRLK